MKEIRYEFGALLVDPMIRVLGKHYSPNGRRMYRDELVARGFDVLGAVKLDPKEDYMVIMPDGERVWCYCSADGKRLTEMRAKKNVTLTAKKSLFGKWREVK